MAQRIPFYALDVETANSDVSSICQIGIAERQSNGRIRSTQNQLINPELAFDQFNIDLHGIAPKHVKRAPTFPKYAPTLKALLTDKVIFSHTDFDKRSLLGAYTRYQLSGFRCIWLDSRDLSRETWDLPNYKLATIANYLGIQFQHHDASADALVCAEIVNHALESRNIDIDDWVEDFHTFRPANRRRWYFLWLR